MVPSSKEVTELLLDWSNGNQAALDRLTPLVHEELHRLAHQHMKRERRHQQGHTLQTSALLNEAYIKLYSAREIDLRNRGHRHRPAPRYFLGLTDEEGAEAIHLTRDQFQKRWMRARQWLFDRLEGSSCQAKASGTSAS